MAREKQYTVNEIRQKWNDYIDYCRTYKVEMATAKGVVTINKPRIPTIGGFANFANIVEETLLNYEKTEGYEAYFSTIKEIKENVKSGKLDSLVNGEGNTTGLIFDLKANYGINDKSIVEHQGEGLKIILSNGGMDGK